MISVQENEAQRGSLWIGAGSKKEDWGEAMTTRTYRVSEKRALEIAVWARIVGSALKREANSAFLAGESNRQLRLGSC